MLHGKEVIKDQQDQTSSSSETTANLTLQLISRGKQL